MDAVALADILLLLLEVAQDLVGDAGERRIAGDGGRRRGMMMRFTR